jgi:hypothetical protein
MANRYSTPIFDIDLACSECGAGASHFHAEPGSNRAFLPVCEAHVAGTGYRIEKEVLWAGGQFRVSLMKLERGS